MQVSQLVELDTHVVIGGGKARSFSMSDSAEFFTVLSDTLYRDKKRAVIREVICNGWDAHIMNDCTDRPLEVTLSNDEIIIQDFGPGISDSRIVPIYCVYGASTKVKDENQTGGFGLGSKAPFAYSDHFSVTSCFEGTKTVYAISRGGSATDGKPEIRQMVSVPTQETGITVTIPLREKDDRHDFDYIIRSVARQGGIKVRLNGVEIEAFDYEPARATGYCAVIKRGHELSESSVYLLYGTVLYPVTTTDKQISDAVYEIENLVSDDYRLVLIAPPNSVGVTPSRESLSYSELTTNTIKSLLRRAKNELRSHLYGVMRNVVTSIGKNTELAQLADLAIERSVRNAVYTTSAVQYGAKAICAGSLGNRYKALPTREVRKWLFDGVIAANPDMRAHLRRSRRENFSVPAAVAVHKFKRFAKLAAKLGNAVEPVIYDDGYSLNYHSNRLRPASQADFDKLKVNPVIFVGPTKRDITSMIVGSKRDPSLRTDQHYLGLVVGRKPSKATLAKITELAEKFAFGVREYDFTVEKPKVVRVKKPTELYHNFADYLSDKELVEAKLEKPKFFMRAYTNSNVMRVGIDDHSVRYMINGLFQDIAIITTTAQEEKLRKAGVPNLLEAVAERLAKLAKSREVQYGIMIQDRLFIPGAASRYAPGVYGVALTLAGMHPNIARLIFPDRAKIGDAWKEAKQLIRILRCFPSSHQNLLKEKQSDVYHAVDRLIAEATQTFKSMIANTEEAGRRFKYLSVLVGSDFIGDSTLSDKQRDELIGVIRYLQRLHDKSKFISHRNVNAQKEAA